MAAVPVEEKDTILIKLIEEQHPYLGIELRRRALQDIRLATTQDKSNHEAEARTAGELLARAEVIAQERRRKEAELKARENARRERERAAKRKKYLESLTGKEAELWSRVDALIAMKQSKRYDEAVSLLQDLHDLSLANYESAPYSHTISQFVIRRIRSRIDSHEDPISIHHACSYHAGQTGEPK